jgi:putative membrane protein
VAIVFAADAFPDPWRFQAHPEVWLLVAFLVGAYVYTARVLGPAAVGPGQATVTKRQTVAFVAAVALLWFAADWPVHDIGENYLYSVHMLQHMVLTYFVAPLVLLATPTWMARVLVGDGRAYRVLSWIAKPVVAGVAFNVMVMVLHIPGLVNASASNGALHYALHLGAVLSAVMMWTPVVGPFREWQIGPGAKCIYLFLMSVVPTVPAGWLTFAEGVVYKHYDQPVRVWGIGVTDDQQIAGVIMKLGGSAFLWAIVVFLFFKRFGSGFHEDNTYVRAARHEAAPPAPADEPLTYEQVAEAFARSSPLVEPGQSPRD